MALKFYILMKYIAFKLTYQSMSYTVSFYLDHLNDIFEEKERINAWKYCTVYN